MQNPDKLPKGLKDASRAYEALAALATDTVVDEDVEGNPIHSLMFVGAVTETLFSVGFNTGSYTKVINALKDMGCIEYLQKGAGGTPTSMILHYPPDLVTFKSITGKSHKSREQNAALQRQIHDLNGRLLKVENQVRMLLSRLGNSEEEPIEESDFVDDLS